MIQAVPAAEGIGVVPVFGGIVAVVVAFLGGFFTFRSAKLTQTASPYAALAERVVHLEKSDERKSAEIADLKEQVSDLTDADEQKGRDLAIVGDHILVLHTWIAGGAVPPPPTTPDGVMLVLSRLRSVSHPGQEA